MKKRKAAIIAAVSAGIVSLSVIGIYAAEHLAEAAAISKEDAYRFALLDAEVNTEDAVLVKSLYEIDNGVSVYDVEFTANGNKYDYDVNAADGSIVERDVKQIRVAATVGENTAPVAPVVNLTEDEALNIALGKAGVSFDSAAITKLRLEKEDGRDVYDIEFALPGEMKFDYEIDAVTGEIIEESTERIVQMPVAPVQTQPQPQPQPQVAQGAAPSADPSTGLTVEDAKAIALKHAGKTADEVVFSKAKLEKDDGIWIFEVEFHVTGLVEYEYEIDAVSGIILEADSEKWDD